MTKKKGGNMNAPTETVKVEVIIDKWGTYKKGDILNAMARSTADACVKHKIVKILTTPKKK